MTVLVVVQPMLLPIKHFFSVFRPSSLLLLVLVMLLASQNVVILINGARLGDSHERPVPALIVFGDSIVDPGNNNYIGTIIKCDFPPYGKDFAEHVPTGRFSNGKIPTDFFASRLGLKEYLPAYLDPHLTPDDLLTGVSFASGGSGYDTLTPKIASVLSLSDQLDMFREYVGQLKNIAGEERAATIVSDSIYFSVIGTDDLANTYFSTPFRKKHYSVSAYTDLMAQSALNFYKELYSSGARKIAVVGLPPVGCVPSQRTLAGGIIRECVDSYNQAARSFNAKLAQLLQNLSSSLNDTTLLYIDIYTPLNNLVQHPSEYGFEVSNKGCCGTGKIEVAVLCNPLSPPCEDVSKYVFWDSYHPTEKAYKIITNNALDNMLPKLKIYI